MAMAELRVSTASMRPMSPQTSPAIVKLKKLSPRWDAKSVFQASIGMPSSLARGRAKTTTTSVVTVVANSVKAPRAAILPPRRRILFGCAWVRMRISPVL